MAEQINAPSAPPAPAPKPSSAERLTPAQWAERLGYLVAADARLPQSESFAKPEHAAADALHGWSRYGYHYQAQPFLISEADYRAALEAAMKYPLVAPCAAALPPSERDRFKDFKPATAAK